MVRLELMDRYFYLYSNEFCDDVPTELQALWSGISFVYTSGNSLGTPCAAYDEWPNFPTTLPSSTTELASSVFGAKSFTGTIPSGLASLGRACSAGWTVLW